MPMGTRTLILVRHGQYYGDEGHARYGKLTPVGREQARRTAKRLAEYPVDVVHVSTMPRAIETARFVRQRVGKVPVKPSHLLREGIPMWAPGLTAEHRANMSRTRKRIDRAFTRYFRPTHGPDRCEVLVCHGNIARYLLRVAIGDPPSRWWRYWPLHCSLSIVVVPQDAPTRIVSINDVGHLPKKLQTVA
jgi:serine/threonine-protein phosphatase PGAM5